MAGQRGARHISAGEGRYTTLEGRSQILDGLDDGDEVVVHSEQALKPDAKVKVVTAIVRSGP